MGEIKQTLNEKTLDEAMQKLVTCHRLTRPATRARRLVENRESGECVHGLSNPLFSFVLATSVDPGTSFEALINRFFDISRQVKRLEVVRALCVLEKGCVIWGVREEGASVRPALFMLEDLYDGIIPVLFASPQCESTLYVLLESLLLHLYQSVLAPEDLAPRYGPETHAIQVPTSLDITLPPDPEWLELLRNPCEHRH